ncbi:24194_t:CDS:2 [Racocetra persica]|uniref:24194_t:CDS:1 n=1 Tax=Racocetra persica TaxID=160502 RepID=A0ACA9ND63_9GLOM|nr:24194_t:CDS:2 [Racocetra persica]
MSEFLYPSDKDLYSLLSLTSEATPVDIKKAYHRLALQYHPDKHTNSTPEQREEATRKFQSLGYAYAVLSDPKKRERYDKTGDVEGFEGFDDMGKEGWDAFFKELWSGVVNSKSIEEFRVEYQGSSEERSDLIDAYKKYKGDMDLIMQHIACGSIEDEPRFIEILQGAISSKEIPSYKKFASSTASAARTKRRKEAEREAKEAEEMAKMYGLDQKLLKNNDEEQLRQLILARGEKRMNALVESLEAKYGGSKPKKQKSTKEKQKTSKKQKEICISEHQ